MAKPKLVLHPDEHTSFKSKYLQPLFEQYFDIVVYDDAMTYDKNTLYAVNCMSKDKQWVSKFEDTAKIIVDNLWETQIPTDYNVISNEAFFWYNESLWYSSLGYDRYIPNKTYKKLAFMPMNIIKRHRSLIIGALSSLLDDFVYSYNGVQLPGDSEKSNPEWQRFMNPIWYDDTYFSMVVETYATNKPTVGLTTEKSFKPIAFYHPFMTFAHQGNLAFLRSLGFESFGNLFDESYDLIDDLSEKLKVIINNVKNFDKVPYDVLTLEKLEYNHNLFFNKELVTKRFTEEIIYPMLEIAHA
jgi:hypothetical protein